MCLSISKADFVGQRESATFCWLDLPAVGIYYNSLTMTACGAVERQYDSPLLIDAVILTLARPNYLLTALFCLSLVFGNF